MAGDLNTMRNIFFEAGKYDEAMKKFEQLHIVFEVSSA